MCLWQFVYIAFLIILQTRADNPLICPEIAAAPSELCLEQFMLSKPRLINLLETVLANALPDNPKSQCKKPRNSSLMTQSLSTYLITKDSWSWLEQSETSSANIEKNWFSFIFLTTNSIINCPQQLIKSFCEVFEI